MNAIPAIVDLYAVLLGGPGPAIAALAITMGVLCRPIASERSRLVAAERASQAAGAEGPAALIERLRRRIGPHFGAKLVLSLMRLAIAAYVTAGLHRYLTSRVGGFWWIERLDHPDPLQLAGVLSGLAASLNLHLSSAPTGGVSMAGMLVSLAVFARAGLSGALTRDLDLLAWLILATALAYLTSRLAAGMSLYVVCAATFSIFTRQVKAARWERQPAVASRRISRYVARLRGAH
jgi:hypothetical protein